MLPDPLNNLPIGTALPEGTTIDVYAGSTLLYTQTVGATDAPYVGSSTYFNTGNYPFSGLPIYFGFSPDGLGRIYFDTPSH
jgi:hypothetical protein